MIYSKDVQFSFIGCPINFTLPLDSTMYQEQFKYTNSLITNQIVQIRISADLYNSNKEIYLISEDRDGNTQRYDFQKNMLSNGFYYAQCYLLIGGQEKYVNYKLYCDDGINSDVLADSNWYYINPKYDDNIKTLKCTHKSNDFNVVFNESLDIINLPISGLPTTYAEVTYQQNNNRFRIRIFTDISDALDVYIFDDDSNELFHESKVYSPYSDSLITDTILLNKNCKVIISSGSNIICNSLYYLYGEKFTRTNTFNLDIECGFLPSDSSLKDEQNDFQQQSFNNKLVFSRPYIEKTLTVGSKLGINKFTYYRLGHFLGCTSFIIGSLNYMRCKDSDLELIENTYQGLGFYKINLQTNNTFSQVDEIVGHIFDYTYPEQFN